MSSFTQVKALRPGRSVFDLSYEKKFDFDMGQIIPVCCEEMVPGDTFKFGNEIVINFQPMFAPVYHEINVYVHYFFVPTRLIFDGWEDFITHGIDGNDATVLPRLDPLASESSPFTDVFGPHSPYDYFGFPVLSKSGVYLFPGYGSSVDSDAYYYRPLAFPWRCMNLVWNEFYMDETLQEKRNLDDHTICYRNWTKDYFTSALPFQQRGTSPSLPLSGNLDVLFTSPFAASIYGGSGESPSTLNPNAMYVGYLDTVDSPIQTVPGAAKGSTFDTQGTHLDSVHSIYASVSASDLNAAGGKVDLGDALTFDVSDLRLAFQLQKFMERAARGGVRYTEFLTSFFGVSPTDARLQRPEYLGGSKSPIVVSQVLQTSQTSGESTPIGRLAGKGLTADKNYIGKYTAAEFGYLCGYMTVMPKPTYQQGVDRKWLRKSFSDFYFPQFAHLSESPVLEEEIFAFPGNDYYVVPDSDPEKKIDNGSVFGYQAAYNEMRMNKDMVCGSLRNSLDYWHLGRQFDTPPQLNSDFITMDPTRDDLKRIFSVTGVPGLICNFGNIITGIRPLPKYGEPGFIDHS